MEDIIIGIDLAKRIVQVHVASGSVQLLLRKRLTPDQFRDFKSRHPPSCVVFEARDSSSYWAREMQGAWPQGAFDRFAVWKPFAERQKNDARLSSALVNGSCSPIEHVTARRCYVSPEKINEVS